MKASAFLPRSESKVVFVIVVVCYARFATSILRTIATAFGAPQLPLSPILRDGYPTLEIIGLLLFAPLFESLVLIGILEFLRWLRFPPWAQVSCSTAVSALLHAPISIPLAFVVVPGWVIMSVAYLMWRRVSWKMGFVIVASIHALLNLTPAIWTIGYAMGHT